MFYSLLTSSVADVNGDGNFDFLRTNHVNNASLSGVYAYEVPENYMDTPWPRHIISEKGEGGEGGDMRERIS